MSDYEHLIYEQRGPVTVITINRPERMNAIGPQTHRELVDAWDRFRADDDALVGVLTGAGDKAFCAGGDLKAGAGRRARRSMPAPTTACSDRRAGPTSTSRPSPRSTASPTRAGWSGPAGPTWRSPTSTPPSGSPAAAGISDWPTAAPSGLPASWGIAAPIDLIITGRVIDAHEAERIGLVNQVVPSGTCLQRALELADDHRRAPPARAAHRPGGRPHRRMADRWTTACASRRNASADRSTPPKPPKDYDNSTNATIRTSRRHVKRQCPSESRNAMVARRSSSDRLADVVARHA